MIAAADVLLSHVGDDARDDLVNEDPATAIEVHFEGVRVHTLADRATVGDQCSTDGYYDATTDPRSAWIIYADDVISQRARFTLLHELGHHLINTDACEVLDLLDRMAGSPARSAQLEELVCHHFAGTLLIPDAVLDTVIGVDRVRPRHVVEIHEQVKDAASWEAVAVRVSGRLRGAGAVVLVRDAGTIGLACGRGLEAEWWARGSPVRPGGPLANALVAARTAQSDTYRWNQPFERTLYCDTLPVHDQLAIAVLSDTPSDGRLNIIDEAEPKWKAREYWCEHCNEERATGWCERCRSPYCTCGRCGCSGPPPSRPPCPNCYLPNPISPGREFCVDCDP